ncbi:hypothetical protein A2V71_04295 [Candidatus Berkelbacteria bacterium RBG_13_40_8]|uniref:Transcriptional repressor PaaX-like central Cas2-like domain-containing protein n=1 Tax=Candidatus Berkelbacteria bacterium RBG_13_40_8 TaxID=1797467 RepID=A0A1F5DNV8_9BACT|nr:MAG: hypothetical protein A2V71_04295 [Candidatus Berkelbacteria bacterium RBG_13_40_8]
MKAKRRIRIKIGEREKEIIEMIGLGTLVIASFALPNLPIALRAISKIRGNKGLQRFLENLEKKNVIYLGDEKIRLTKKGKDLLRHIQIAKIKIQKPKKWDGIWWLISYDIPKTHNRERDYFRSMLKRLEFCQIQASLWVYPYECKQEIAVIAKELNVSPFVIAMATDNLPNQKEMENYFNL